MGPQPQNHKKTLERSKKEHSESTNIIYAQKYDQRRFWEEKRRRTTSCSKAINYSFSKGSIW